MSHRTIRLALFWGWTDNWILSADESDIHLSWYEKYGLTWILFIGTEQDIIYPKVWLNRKNPCVIIA